MQESGYSPDGTPSLPQHGAAGVTPPAGQKTGFLHRWVKRYPVLVSTMGLLGALMLSVAVGSVFIPPGQILRLLFDPLQGQDNPQVTILFVLRLPRTVLTVLVGAALSSSGAAYQGLFRNPLADPYLIGVAAGAGLGAVAAMSLRLSSNLTGMFTIPLFAFAAGICTIGVVYQLARVGRTTPTTNLLLSGVAVSSFATALTSFVMMRSTGELRRALIWLLGGSTLSGWQPVLAMLPYTVLGVAVLWSMGHAMNVMQFGEDQAQQLGINTHRARLWVVGAASLTTAAAVSFSGIIGFVGLIVPHIVRLVWGPDYRRLIPLSALNGASLLLAADVLSRVLLAPQEIPVGIITALCGAPFFVWVLNQVKNQAYGNIF